MIRKRLKANITLTFVLMSMGILLFIGISLILSTIDVNSTTKSFGGINIAKLSSNACVEESLYRIKNDNTFIGTFTIPFTNGSCSADVENSLTNPSQKLVSVSSNYDIYYYQLTKIVDFSSTPYQVFN